MLILATLKFEKLNILFIKVYFCGQLCKKMTLFVFKDLNVLEMLQRLLSILMI